MLSMAKNVVDKRIHFLAVVWVQIGPAEIISNRFAQQKAQHISAPRQDWQIGLPRY